ncbi:hypothetical protein HED51_13855 [Ochrobactrum grignonense]|nr:hypothetical protein [Brucella grignonensis]
MGDFHHILKGRGGFPSGFVEVRSRRNNSSSLTSPRQRQNPARAADKLNRHHGLKHFQQKWMPVLHWTMHKTNSYSGSNDSVLTGAAVWYFREIDSENNLNGVSQCLNR